VALEFHRQSPLRHGPFVVLYGERDDERLSRALTSRVRVGWEHAAHDPLLEADGGTVFFDSFERFSIPTQRLLLDFVRSATASPRATEWAGRLAAGSDFDLSMPLPRSEGDPSPLVELFDCLDKIRIDLEPALAGGWA
jgi:DNA-binding NtrC family response regulator